VRVIYGEIIIRHLHEREENKGHEVEYFIDCPLRKGPEVEKRSRYDEEENRKQHKPAHDGSLFLLRVQSKGFNADNILQNHKSIM
jgi:hypothetical protein